MFAISNDEMDKAPDLGDEVICPRCFILHKVQISYGEGKDDGSDPLRLHFYQCNGTAYLAGINGKDVRHRFSYPE